MRIFLTISVLLLATLLVAEKTSYKGYKLVRVSVSDKGLLEKINSYENVDPEFDVWGVQLENGRYVITIMLSPKVITKYLRILKSLKVDVEIAHDNVQELLNNEERDIEISKLKQKATRSIVNTYASYPQIINFIKDTVDANPGFATSSVIGHSIENKQLTAITFSTGPKSRGLWIDCGIHAREWVTPATCVYIIDQIVNEYRANDPQMVALLDKYDISILPLYNPDGYEYSRTNDRMWRKNRNKNILGVCYGVDLNRNADYRWNTGGASSVTCIDTYAGTGGNSEPETKAVTSALLAKPAGFWDAYFSVHSYGNWWLLPWGHDASLPPPPALQANGEIGAAAIKAKSGDIFTVGSSSALLYVTTGSTADWAYEVAKVPFAATLELTAGNTTTTSYGFQFPADGLPKLTEGTWAGVKAAFVDISARRP